MFKLIDGTELTEEIKDAFKKKVTKAYIKLKDGTILSGENFLKSLEIEDLRYNEETNNFLGEAVAKRATVDLYNKDNAINVEDEEFEAFIGAELSDGTTAWISYGNFIVQKPENDDTKEDTVIEAFDYMCKFNKIYTPGVTFPCTYADIVEDICEQCGVELANRDFRNAEKVVKENFFINGEQCRAVLKQVAKIAFSWARVGNDNKLYIDFKNKDIEETFENFDLDSYIDLNKNNQLIPVDTIVLRNSAIESENVTIKFDKNAKINKFIGDMEQDTIEAVAGTTVENNSVHVTDVDLDFETEVLPMGNISQETTVGYNLLGNYTTGSYGCTVSTENIENGKKITVNAIINASNHGFYFSLIPNLSSNANLQDGDKILIKYKIKTTNTSVFASNFGRLEGAANTTFYPSTSGTLTNTFHERYMLGTYNANAPYKSFVFYTNTMQVGDVFEIKDVMFCKSDVDLPYEPYTGGQAMPNINYPSEAKGVGGIYNRNICPTDFSKWETGGYNVTDGTKVGAPKRIRLIDLLEVTPNTAYYFNTFHNDFNYVVREYDENKAFVASTGGIANGNTLTVRADTKYLGVGIYRVAGEESASFAMYQELAANGEFKPFICLNSETDKTYVEHKEYCRYNTVFSNRNLFDEKSIFATKTINGLTAKFENGKLSIVGTPTVDTNLNWGYKLDNSLLNKEITLSYSGDLSTINNVGLKKAGSDRLVLDRNMKSKTITATQTIIDDINQISFWCTKNQVINASINIQLEVGTAATPYTPHQSQTLPIDIPLGQEWYSGKPYKVGSKWYKKIEWYNKIFNGTETWKTSSYSNDEYLCAYTEAGSGVYTAKQNSERVYCNYFPQGLYTNTSTKECIANNGYTLNIKILKSRLSESNEAGLQTFCKELYDNGTPMETLYQLSTPIVEEITDAHLIAQLEALQAAELYEGVTNINSYKTSDEVAEMPLSVRYNFVTPAPSTDRESPINKVTGACNLYNVRGNLFDINDKKEINNTYIQNSDDSLSLTFDNTAGTAVKYFNWYTHKTNRLKPNSQYYAVAEILDVSGTGSLALLSTHGNSSQVKSFDSKSIMFADVKKGDVIVKPFITVDDFSKVTFMLRTFCSFNAGQSGSITFRISVFEDEPDLEKFVYKKFNSQQFPLNLGSLELLNGEYIYWKDNKWYKHKLIDKYDSNIDKEGWVAEAGNATGSGEPYLRFRKTVPNATSKPIRQAIISNRFVSTLDGKHPIGGSFAWGYQIFIYPPKEITTADLLKEWFVSNPTIIYYYTETPIEEEITDTTLLSQLNAIKDEFFLVEGENHIMFSCDNGTQPQLEIKHYPNKYSLKETISTGNDLTLSASYEHRELVVKEDYFAYNEETRRDLIESARELFGLTYLPVDLSGIGTAYLENNDLVTVTDKMGNVRPTYCLNHILKYNGVLYDTIAAPAMTETETKYQNESQEDLSRRRTEVIVNKATQEIQLVSEKVDTYDSRISEVEVGLDGIISKIESDIDITRTINGLKTLTLEECLEGDLLELHIYGNNQVFKRITPSGTTYPSDELIVKDDSLIKITRKEIDEEGNYIGETSETIDLKIKEVLRQLGDVADSFDLVNNKATLTRRIGVNTDNSLYVLTNPIVEDLGDLKIPLVRGTNIIEIVNYSAMMSAKYVIINAFTNTFATTVDLKSAIEILYNQINLEVSKKVNDDEIIARINMAILGRDEVEIPDDINKSIIEILANKISIKSDNFELTKDGTVTAKEGNIAGFKMLKPTNSTAWLVYDNEKNGKKYRSGFYQSSGFVNFLFAGLTSFNEEGTEFNFEDVPFEVTSDGVVSARYINLNGESGFANVRFDSGKIAMSLTAKYLDFRLDNNDNALFARFERKTEGFYLYLQNAPMFSIYDNLHNRLLYQANTNNGNRPNHYFVGQMWKDYDTTGTYYAVVTEQTCSCSDKRLKDNVKDSETSGLDRINKMQFRQFDWNKQSPTPDVHVDIGIVAQELKEIDENYVGEFTRLYNGEEQKLYNINDLNLITTGLKAIQELSAENNKLKETVDKQQKIIDFLINKLDCKDEISEILKEGE